MKPIIAIKNFIANDTPYIIGDEIKGLNYEQIVKLNENGLIEPLTYEDLVIIKRQLENKEEKL